MTRDLRLTLLCGGCLGSAVFYTCDWPPSVGWEHPYDAYYSRVAQKLLALSHSAAEAEESGNQRAKRRAQARYNAVRQDHLLVVQGWLDAESAAARRSRAVRYASFVRAEIEKRFQSARATGGNAGSAATYADAPVLGLNKQQLELWRQLRAEDKVAVDPVLRERLLRESWIQSGKSLAEWGALAAAKGEARTDASDNKPRGFDAPYEVDDGGGGGSGGSGGRELSQGWFLTQLQVSTKRRHHAALVLQSFERGRVPRAMLAAAREVSQAAAFKKQVAERAELAARVKQVCSELAMDV